MNWDGSPRKYLNGRNMYVPLLHVELRAREDVHDVGSSTNSKGLMMMIMMLVSKLPSALSINPLQLRCWSELIDLEGALETMVLRNPLINLTWNSRIYVFLVMIVTILNENKPQDKCWRKKWTWKSKDRIGETEEQRRLRKSWDDITGSK